MLGRLREVRTVEELLALRRGAFLVGRRYACFFVDPDLAGYFAWGHIVQEDAAEGLRTYGRLLRTAPRALLADLTGVSHLDNDAARSAAESIERRLAKYGPLDLAHAVVHPAGLHGATIAGFLSAFPPGFSHRAFASRADALEWLGRSDALEFVNELESRARVRAHAPDEVRRLRELLASDPAGAWTLDRAVQSLRIAKRTLQLRLEQAGTSFREELAAVRLSLVKDRLRGDHKLLAVAIDSGFTSAQHFSRWFRSQTGMTPSEYRKNAEELGIVNED